MNSYLPMETAGLCLFIFTGRVRSVMSQLIQVL
jgi:hypothetical protein